MPLEFSRSPEQIRTTLTRAARDHGYTRTDRFIGAFIDVFTDNFSPLYSQLQDYDPQTRIDTATGIFLDSFGIMLSEPRSRIFDLSDQSLDNVYIATESGLSVTNYTVGATPLFIPDGARILDENGVPLFATMDSLVMDSPRAFTRIVGIPGLGSGNIAVGTYKLDGSIQDYVLGRTSAAIPSGQVTIEDTNLVAVVQRPIIGSPVALSDDEYRFILFSKADSINQANKSKVNTALANNQIARFVIREFVSGSSSVLIYIEPTRGPLGKAIEAAMKLTLSSIMPYGTLIRVARVVNSRIELDIRASMLEGTPPSDRPQLVIDLKAAARDAINAIPSAGQIDFNSIIQILQAVPNAGDVFIDSIRVNGRTMIGGTYKARDIEKPFATDQSVFISLI